MRRGIGVRVTWFLGLLKQCPHCYHYYGPDNGFADEEQRRGEQPTPALAQHCIPCGDEVVATIQLESVAL